MTDYAEIFNSVEETLIGIGSQRMPEGDIRRKLDDYKQIEGRTFSDADIFWRLVQVVFYSGFKAETITLKLDVIREHFPGYETVSAYGDDQVSAIERDPKMIRNARKIRACVQNAQTLQFIVRQHGSFQAYIDAFAPGDSFENLMLLKEELEYRFKGLGRITTYHLLTDIGMPVLKPDRVICRIFRRLGLIESE